MKKRVIRHLIIGSLAAMALSIAYAFVRLYVMNQRVDFTIILANVMVFSAAAGVFIYLAKKQKDIEEEEMFKD